MQMLKIGCSGVTTVARYKIFNQRFEKLPTTGYFWANETFFTMMGNGFVTRKVLFIDIEVLNIFLVVSIFLESPVLHSRRKSSVS